MVDDLSIEGLTPAAERGYSRNHYSLVRERGLRAGVRRATVGVVHLMRPFFKNSLRWLAAASAVLCAGRLFAQAPAPIVAYIGTFTNTGSAGVYRVRLNPADGSISAPAVAARTRDPEYLAFSPDQTQLYVANELESTISAYAVDRATGALRFLNRQPTGGGNAAHLAVDPSGRILVVADYPNGTVAVFPIRPDGSLGRRSGFYQQRGPHGPNSDRQKGPHAHCVTFSPDGRFVTVCDLGLDRVFVYRVDAEHGTLTPDDPAFASVPPGAGARHSVFSPDGRFLYVVNEMGGSVCVFAYDAANGALTLRQTISTLPASYHGFNGSAEIAVSPDGRFVYASNRGPNSIAVFAASPADGRLTRVEITPSGGDGPRGFALSPDGKWLLCANQNSNNVRVFAVNRNTGRLTLTPAQASIPQPVCVLFLR